MRNLIPHDFLQLLKQISTFPAKNFLVLFKVEMENFFAAVTGKIGCLHKHVIFTFPQTGGIINENMTPIRIILAIRFLTIEKYRYCPIINSLAAVAQADHKLFMISKTPNAVAAEMYFRGVNITQQCENSAI